jgi:hypothetical protein
LFVGTQLKVTDLNTIRVIPFCGKVIWSERFFANSRRFGFKDLLLGKLSIPTVDEEIEEESESGKKKSGIIELYEIAYTELILLIDIKTSSGSLLLIQLKAAKVRTILMAMRPLRGKG